MTVNGDSLNLTASDSQTLEVSVAPRSGFPPNHRFLPATLDLVMNASSRQRRSWPIADREIHAEGAAILSGLAAIILAELVPGL
jgi:hypothetical protein